MRYTPKQRWRRRAALLVLCLATVAVLPACSSGSGASFANGDSATVFGGTVNTFARTADGLVRSAGMSLPLTTVAAAPASRQNHGEGTGPAGAWAVLDFPASTQQTTVLNHAEIHWNMHGHPPNVFAVPHFDFHFYTIPEHHVMAITPADTHVPAANRVPAGYSNADSVQAYQAQIVPQMGFHSLLLADLGKPFTATMVLGYYGGSLIFIEPMITQEHLLMRQSFTMDVAVPPVFGRSTLYPTRFVATYDPGADAYQMLFDSFVHVN
ncbi:MAG: hypothetical protein HZB16_14440 [Armatimonadetes bacterium]|nr:hypothetical protein [Armatimonadota bacterium]